MLIDLSEVLSGNQKTISRDAKMEMKEIHLSQGYFPVKETSPVSLNIERIKRKELRITGMADVRVQIPCDRCLKEVDVDFHLQIEKHVDLDTDTEKPDQELDESNFIDGYNLDVDKLLYNEILIGWPMKILCSEDCKGICNVCGQNLNEGDCDCEDTSLDPRMSVIRDLFKNFKEV